MKTSSIYRVDAYLGGLSLGVGSCALLEGAMTGSGTPFWQWVTSFTLVTYGSVMAVRLMLAFLNRAIEGE